jgi:hypothetical protein
MLFWVVATFGLVGRYQRFAETYCLHIQGQPYKWTWRWMFI